MGILLMDNGIMKIMEEASSLLILFQNRDGMEVLTKIMLTLKCTSIILLYKLFPMEKLMEMGKMNMDLLP